MIGLEEAKEYIRRAGRAVSSDRVSEIDSSSAGEQGWEHLGEDYFYNAKSNQIAGPRGEGAVRILVTLSLTLENAGQEIEAEYDLALEWDRLAGDSSSPELGAEVLPRGITAKDSGRKLDERCACDM